MSSEQETRLHDQIFRLLWAFAAIFHQVAAIELPIRLSEKGLWSSALFDITLNFAACLVLVNPKKNLWFVSLLISIIAKFYSDLPFVSNHFQLFALASVVLLVDLKNTHRFATDSLRLTTVVVYLLVTLHKLNTAFFSHPGSCADRYGRPVLEGFLPHFLSEPALNLLPAIIIGFEGSIAILLLSKRWVHLGVIAGFILHFALGWDVERRFYNFSALMFVLLFTFNSSHLTDSIVKSSKENDFLKRLLVLFSNPRFRLSIAMILFAAQFGLHPINSDALKLLCFRIIIAIWFICSLILTSLAVCFVRRTSSEQILWEKISLRIVLLPIIVLLIGTGPYLGFRTRLSLDMYSNLNVENGKSNHFFLPSLDLWGYFEDSITIVQSSDLKLKDEYIGTGHKMVALEFDRYLNSHPSESIEYIRRGERLSSSALDKPQISLYENKLLAFRPIQPLDDTSCQW